jgi:arylsulfatase A
VDIATLFDGTSDSVRKDFLYYASSGNIEGIREGNWKLLIRQKDSKKDSQSPAKPQVLLFNLSNDLVHRS